MQYSLTVFKSIFDNKTNRKMDLPSWEAFVDLLEGLSKKPGYKPKKDEKFHPKASPLISPAIFKAGETRKNANVLYWGGWAALDIDDYGDDFAAALKTFEGYRCVCYSSASSTKEKPKFRIVFCLSRRVKADEIRHFWYALNSEFNSLGDPQTKDLARMYYVPAQYENAFNFFLENKNKPPLDVDDLLKKYEYARDQVKTSLVSNLPAHIQEKIVEYRKTKLTNTSYSWSGLHDCPFVNMKLVNEYRAIMETGWYRKMFQIMISIASNATRKGYPITSSEIAKLCRELDAETGGWYAERNMEAEADRAIAYACKDI